MPTTLRLLVLIISICVAAQGAAQAQIPGLVRVVEPGSPILRWLSPAPRDIIAVVEPGVALEVLDREGGYYWIVTPRDANGSRRAGWIAVQHVENAPEAARTSTPQPLSDSTPPVSGAQEDASLATADSRPVSITESEVAVAPRRYELDDVGFERDRFSIGPEAIRALDVVVAALGTDRMLALTIEGHTCTLGTPAYNRGLGQRRAAAVRDYLLSRGVAADRLRVVSYGDERPRYDNTREETRRLNRRVVLVPDE